MRLLKQLFEQNRQWVAEITQREPDFFARLAQQQTPEYLWIGCSDSRVPATQIVNLAPGEMFVHRNVANLMVHSDLNCLAVLQYAVEVLKVKHIIVCGHYGCGGVLAALREDRFGLIDNWLQHVRDIKLKHMALLNQATGEKQRHGRLCELNVIEQTVNVCQTTIVRDAWTRNQTLSVHSWIYDIHDGLLRDLGMCVAAENEIPESYTTVLATIEAPKLLG
jgi:carbonic anhydrase